MKTSIFLFIFCMVGMSLLSCNDTESSSNSNGEDLTIDTTPNSTTTNTVPPDSIMSNEEIEDDIELHTSSVVSPPTKKVAVIIHSITGYWNDENFARMAADTLQVILNSAGFKRAVVNTQFAYHYRGMNGQQIYDTIISAQEENGQGGQTKVVDLRLRTITAEQDGRRWIRRCNRSTVGIDGGGSGVAAVCSNWLRSAANGNHYSWMAAHLIHEYMHILDFSHSDYKSE